MKDRTMDKIRIVTVMLLYYSDRIFNKKMADTSVVFGKLLLATSRELGTVRELELFLHQVALRRFKFATFGFLSLDLSLLLFILEPWLHILLSLCTSKWQLIF
jgi:hypothetical protein